MSQKVRKKTSEKRNFTQADWNLIPVPKTLPFSLLADG